MITRCYNKAEFVQDDSYSRANLDRNNIADPCRQKTVKLSYFNELSSNLACSEVIVPAKNLSSTLLICAKSFVVKISP